MLLLGKKCHFLNGKVFPVSSSLSQVIGLIIHYQGLAEHHQSHHRQWMESLQHPRESVLHFPFMSYEPCKKEVYVARLTFIYPHTISVDK